MLQHSDRAGDQAGLTVLPNEIWAQVFAHLQPGSAQATPLSHAWFHALRRVCSRFRTVFDENPQLSRHLCVPDHEDSAVAKYGLNWFKKNSHVFKTFQSDASTPQEVFLKALMILDSQLTKVLLRAFRQDTLACCRTSKS